MPDDGQGGNLSNLWKDINNSNASGLQVTAGVIGTLADLGGAIGFVQLGLSVIESLFDLDDEAQSDLATIEAGFNQLEGQISASDKLQRMRDVDQAITPAAGVFQQLPAILAADPPVTDDFKLAQIQKCIDAVLFFTDSDVKWEVVAAEMPYYSDSWSGRLAPQAGSDGLVFNYTYTLPQFLRAIYFLLTAIAALTPKSLNLYINILTKCLTRLQSVHETILNSGIVPYRVPAREDVGKIYYLEPLGNTNTYPGGPTGLAYPHVFTDDGSPTIYQPGADGWDPSSPYPHFFCRTDWVKKPSSGSAQDGINWPYGAVEIYSGANNVSSYSSDYFPHSKVDLSFWPQVAAGNFFGLLSFRIYAKMRSLYISLGMPSVWQTINHLLQLTGQPLPSAPIYSAWQFADVIGLLGLTLPPPHGHQIVDHSLEPAGFEDALRAFLQATPPYLGFQALTNKPYISDSFPIDWNYATVTVPSTPLPTAESLYTFLTGVTLGTTRASTFTT
jgi:hypothetical protein